MADIKKRIEKLEDHAEKENREYPEKLLTLLFQLRPYKDQIGCPRDATYEEFKAYIKKVGADYKKERGYGH